MERKNKRILQDEDKYKIKFVFNNTSNIDINEIMKKSFIIHLENLKNQSILKQCKKKKVIP